MEDNISEQNNCNNIPKHIFIKGYELNFKQPPLKDNILRYRCRNGKCNYFVKIDQENLKKLIDKGQNNVVYTEYSKHDKHNEDKIVNFENGNIATEFQINKIARQLIILNLNEP